jgi:hypothetical protein
LRALANMRIYVMIRRRDNIIVTSADKGDIAPIFLQMVNGGMEEDVLYETLERQDVDIEAFKKALRSRR